MFFLFNLKIKCSCRAFLCKVLSIYLCFASLVCKRQVSNRKKNENFKTHMVCYGLLFSYSSKAFVMQKKHFYKQSSDHKLLSTALHEYFLERCSGLLTFNYLYLFYCFLVQCHRSQFQSLCCACVLWGWPIMTPH